MPEFVVLAQNYNKELVTAHTASAKRIYQN